MTKPRGRRTALRSGAAMQSRRARPADRGRRCLSGRWGRGVRARGGDGLEGRPSMFAGRPLCVGRLRTLHSSPLHIHPPSCKPPRDAAPSPPCPPSAPAALHTPASPRACPSASPAVKRARTPAASPRPRPATSATIDGRCDDACAAVAREASSLPPPASLEHIGRPPTTARGPRRHRRAAPEQRAASPPRSLAVSPARPHARTHARSLPHGHRRPAAPAVRPVPPPPRPQSQRLCLARARHGPRPPRPSARAREEAQGQEARRPLGAAEADPGQDCPARARCRRRQGAGAGSRCVVPFALDTRPLSCPSTHVLSLDTRPVPRHPPPAHTLTCLQNAKSKRPTAKSPPCSPTWTAPCPS